MTTLDQGHQQKSPEKLDIISCRARGGTKEAVDAMAISDQEKQMIYEDNAKALLKL
jgi:hypothetical protein